MTKYDFFEGTDGKFIVIDAETRATIAGGPYANSDSAKRRIRKLLKEQETAAAVAELPDLAEALSNINPDLGDDLIQTDETRDDKGFLDDFQVSGAVTMTRDDPAVASTLAVLKLAKNSAFGIMGKSEFAKSRRKVVRGNRQVGVYPQGRHFRKQRIA